MSTTLKSFFDLRLAEGLAGPDAEIINPESARMLHHSSSFTGEQRDRTGTVVLPAPSVAPLAAPSGKPAAVGVAVTEGSSPEAPAANTKALEFAVGMIVSGTVADKLSAQNREVPYGVLVFVGNPNCKTSYREKRARTLLLHMSEMAGATFAECQNRCIDLKVGEVVTGVVIEGRGAHPFGFSELRYWREESMRELVKGGAVKAKLVRAAKDADGHQYGWFASLSREGKEYIGQQGLLHFTEVSGRGHEEKMGVMLSYCAGQELEAVIVEEPRLLDNGRLRIRLSTARV